MHPIPPYVRGFLAEQPRMKKCAVEHQIEFGECSGRLEWDHTLIIAGKQCQDPFAIVAVCHGHHSAKEGNKKLKAAIQLTSFRLMTDTDRARYPRTDWKQMQKYAVSVNATRMRVSFVAKRIRGVANLVQPSQEEV